MKPFFDPWESQTERERKQVIQERLTQYIQFAKHNTDFYRKRLDSFDSHARHPLREVPVLTSQELREHLPPQGSSLLTKSVEAATVFQSGGTTGFPKTALFSHEEMDGLYLPNARGFHALGLTRQDRVGNLFAVGSLYMTFLHIHRMLEQYGCMNFPFSNHTSSDFVHTVVKLFKINCLTGITSVILGSLRKISEIGLDGIQIEKIYYGGEHIYEADKRELREKFGVRQIAAPGYGTVDTWYLGYQCSECPTGIFHAHDDQSYLEIVDEESGTHCEPGEIGMMYCTALPRRLTPIIRYQVGDRARWLDGRCPCGRTTPLFELLGRGDDVLRIGFDSVDYAFIQESITQIKRLSGTVQMEKKRKEGRDLLILRVETDAESEMHASLRAALENEILNRRPSLREFIAGETVWPLQIELLAPDSLPRNSRTGKLIRVIDAL